MANTEPVLTCHHCEWGLCPPCQESFTFSPIAYLAFGECDASEEVWRVATERLCAEADPEAAREREAADQWCWSPPPADDGEAPF